MASGPAALEWSRSASIFKIPASEILIWGIYGTLGLNVPGIFPHLGCHQLVHPVQRFLKDGSVSKMRLG